MLCRVFACRHRPPSVFTISAAIVCRDAALVSSHKANDVRPFTAMVRTCVLRGFAALDALWQAARAPAVAAAGAVRRSTSASALRDEARKVRLSRTRPVLCLTWSHGVTRVVCV